MSNRLLIIPILLIGLIAGLLAPAAADPPAPPTASADSAPAAPADSSPAAPLAGTVLLVNHEAITSGEVLFALREQLSQNSAKMTPEQFVTRAQPLIQQELLARISEMLLYQHAQRDIEEQDGYEEALETVMDEQTRNLLAQYHGSVAQAQEELAKTGTTLKEQLENRKRDLIIARYRQIYFADTDLTRAEMYQYYKNHLRDEFSHSALIQPQVIEIPVAEFLPDHARSHPSEDLLAQARAQALQNAQDAWQKIQNGADFAAVVKDHSFDHRKAFDGVWRPVCPDDLVEKYQPLIESLEKIEIGQATGIVEAGDRFFIAKLLERTPAKITPFAEAQFQIAEILQDKRWQKYREKIIETLYGKATIGNIELFLAQTTQLAYLRYQNPN